MGEERGPGVESRTGNRAKMINAEMDVGPASSEPYLLSKLDSFNQEREKQQCQSARE